MTNVSPFLCGNFNSFASDSLLKVLKCHSSCSASIRNVSKYCYSWGILPGDLVRFIGVIPSKYWRILSHGLLQFSKELRIKWEHENNLINSIYLLGFYVFFFFLVLMFWDEAVLHVLRCPETQYIAQNVLQFIWSCLSSLSTGIKSIYHQAWSFYWHCNLIISV